MMSESLVAAWRWAALALAMIAVPNEAGAEHCDVASAPLPNFRVEAPSSQFCSRLAAAAVASWSEAGRLLGDFGFDPEMAASSSILTTVDDRPSGDGLLETRVEDGTLVAKVTVSLPRTKPANRALDGTPHDWRHLERTLVHEFATVQADLLLRAKPNGFRLYDSPRWFYQGLPEHVASRTDQRRRKTYAKIARDGSENVYVIGHVLVTDLVNRHGAAQFRQFLACPRSFHSCLATMASRGLASD